MPKKLTTEEFITKAKEVHGDKYDYSKVQYVNSKIKVVIICLLHGEFQQQPAEHLYGKGCRTCSIEKQTERQTFTQEQFVTRAKDIHNNKYNYSKSLYQTSNTKIKITCPKHGDFIQKAAAHLQGQGCPECAKEKLNGLFSKSVEIFINEANIAHNNKYKYKKVDYVNGRTKVIITCHIHGDFEQSPNAHLSGQGCSSCATSGFDQTKPAILYYLKITTDSNQTVYKIGVTNRTVEARFSLRELSKIEIVKQKLYDNGQDAWDWEQKLLKTYKQYQYTGLNILESGNTELFTEDIIAMYYAENNLS